MQGAVPQAGSGGPASLRRRLLHAGMGRAASTCAFDEPVAQHAKPVDLELEHVVRIENAYLLKSAAVAARSRMSATGASAPQCPTRSRPAKPGSASHGWNA
jgi:hypothetical protein